MKQAIPRSEEAPPDASVESPVDMSVSTPVADVFNHSDEVFPIVGIGASAGGLEALELFLANVPAGSGMAFVIVQHLDPTQKGMLPELLQRSTGMQVFQVKDRTRVKPDSVYVIPPNKDMSILHGVLHLLDPVARRGLRLPINFFFCSLADDQREHSIGVILSGMGSDGTLGLRAIKEKAGAVFVQEPASAKFDSMPRSAIDAGLADVIAPVEALPGKISAYVQHVPIITKSRRPLGEDTAQSALEKVALLLRSQTGHDFSLYKKTTVYRRIERRMGLHKISKIATYVRFLQENPQEVELLFRDLLIGVTSFFRDPEAWKQLKAEVLPALLSGRTFNQPLRAWIPACSTGEEAYSLAILFKETLEELKPAKNITLQIFATDLDRQAIEKAREGVFPANIAADISKKRLNRFFVKMERGYQVAKVIREMVIFAPQNIIMDPPFTKLALISCRNLLIYLMPELQKKLFPLFHYSLNPGGFLFLGNAETVGNFTNLFAPLAGKPRGDTAGMAEMEQELESAHQEVQSLREEMQASQEELKSANEELQSANEEMQSTNEELTTSKEEMQSMNEELHTVNQELQTRMDELSRTSNDMKNLLDSTDIATLFLDNSLCVRRFTSETSKVTKLIPGDAGRPITDIASALLYPELADDAREVLRTLVKVERQIPIPDGNWFAARILPYRTLDNMIDGIVITFVDITVSKKLEAELRATEARSREILEYAESIINTVREPLIALDQDLRVVTVSRSFYEVFKVKPEETVGQLIYNLGNKQWDIPKLRELLETILPEKTTFDDYEVEHDFTTIGRRIMLLNARQIERASGKERIILLAIEDITVRKRAEEALNDQQE